MQSNKKWIIIVIILVIAGVAAYFLLGNKGSEQEQSNSSASKKPAKSRILGLDKAPEDLKTFVNAEFDAQNSQCQKQSGEEVAMGLRSISGEKFAVISIACGDNGTAAYYVKENNSWKQAFKTEELPTCDQVNAVKFTKEIIPECIANNDVVENQNP